MGMNFYVFDKTSPSKRGAHIGKRSAAGVWCWDCKEEAAESKGVFFCFFCGAKRSIKDKTMFSPAFRELGFDRTTPRAREGIDGAGAFTWQLGSEGDNLGATTVKEMEEKVSEIKDFINEYDEHYAADQFKAVLSECLIRRFSFSNFT